MLTSDRGKELADPKRFTVSLRGHRLNRLAREDLRRYFGGSSPHRPSILTVPAIGAEVGPADPGNVYCVVAWLYGLISALEAALALTARSNTSSGRDELSELVDGKFAIIGAPTLPPSTKASRIGADLSSGRTR